MNGKYQSDYINYIQSLQKLLQPLPFNKWFISKEQNNTGVSRSSNWQKLFSTVFQDNSSHIHSTLLPLCHYLVQMQQYSNKMLLFTLNWMLHYNRARAMGRLQILLHQLSLMYERKIPEWLHKLHSVIAKVTSTFAF